MATLEAEVISAVLENKDVHVILGEDGELFGGFEDVFDYVKSYYTRHKIAPTRDILEEKFGDIELPSIDAPSRYYLDKLKNQFLNQRIEDIITKAAKALDADKPGGQILEKAQTAFSKLNRYTNTARDVDITDGEEAADYFERLQEIAQAKGGQPGIATGFKPFDLAYPMGLAPGHSIVLMGYTGRGKSMASCKLAVNVHNKGYKVMVISLEMSPAEYRERAYAMMSEGQFKISDMSRGEVQTDDFRQWSKRELSESAGFIVVSPEGYSDITPNIIQAKIDIHKPDLVILDYLQLMTDNAKSQAMTPRMMNLSREVKMLAVSNAIPVISITAVTDEDGDKRDHPPLLKQVAWSKAIEYDANLAIAVHRHDDTDVVEWACRKNRHGPLFNFYHEVDFNSGIWTERFDL